MKPAIEHSLLKQFSLPLDDMREVRMQHYYENNIKHFLKPLKTLVHAADLPEDEKHSLLWFIAYIETHIENQTQDMETALKAGCN